MCAVCQGQGAAYMHAHGRLLRDFGLGALILVLSVQIGVSLVPVFDGDSSLVGWAPAVLTATITLAVTASVLCLVLLRVASNFLTLTLGVGVALDALLSTTELLGKGTWLSDNLYVPADSRALLSMWPLAGLLLVGAWHSLGSSPFSGDNAWLQPLAATAALAVALGLLTGLSSSVPSRTDPEQLWLHPGIGFTQILAVLSLAVLYRARNERLARWAGLSLLPGIAASLVLAWYGPGNAAALMSASVLRGGAYLLAGVGAWTAIKDSLILSDRGLLSIQLVEEVRDAVAASVQPEVMARKVAQVVGDSLHLDSVDVLLKTPSREGLYMAGRYTSAGNSASHENGNMSPQMQALLAESTAGRSTLRRGLRVSRTETALPLVAHEQEIGLIIAARRDSRGLHDSDLVLLNIAVGQLAMGLSNAQLLLESQSRLNRAEALRWLAVQTSRDICMPELVELVLRQAKGLTGMERSELFLLDEPTGGFLKSPRSGGGALARMPMSGVYRQALETRRVAVRAGAEPGMAAPLIAGEEVVGVLAVHAGHAGVSVTEEEEVALQAMADQSVIALERARLAAKVARNQEETDALYSISKDVLFVLDLQQGLQSVTEKTRKVLRCDLAAVLLLDMGETAAVIAASGPREVSAERTDLRLDGAIAQRISASDEPVMLRDAGEEPELYPLLSRLGVDGKSSLMAVPLQAHGHSLGALLIGHCKRQSPSEEEVFLAQRISRQTAIAIENSRLLGAEQETVAKLRQLDSIKSSVIHSASHELRTPLSVIKGYIDILRETAAPALAPQQVKALDTVARETDNVLRLVEDMTTAFALESGGIELRPERTQAGYVIERAISVVRDAAERAGIELSTDVSSHLPQIAADRAKVEQALVHLINNALKFTPRGGSVWVTVRPEGDSLRFTVSDTGPGVPVEDQTRLFQAFGRGSRVVDDAVRGTGLGLAICKGIVEAHGGRIGLDTETRQGASFWFMIPVAGVPAWNKS